MGLNGRDIRGCRAITVGPCSNCRHGITVPLAGSGGEVHSHVSVSVTRRHLTTYVSAWCSHVRPGSTPALSAAYGTVFACVQQPAGTVVAIKQCKHATDPLVRPHTGARRLGCGEGWREGAGSVVYEIQG